MGQSMHVAVLTSMTRSSPNLSKRPLVTCDKSVNRLAADGKRHRKVVDFIPKTGFSRHVIIQICSTYLVRAVVASYFLTHHEHLVVAGHLLLQCRVESITDSLEVVSCQFGGNWMNK